MSSEMNYPCNLCNYVANNHRMLARHIAITHSTKVYKCPLCPFVSRYQTNLHRHKRDVHSLHQGAPCEICGLSAPSIEALVAHKEAAHPEELQRIREKYEREKERLSIPGYMNPPKYPPPNNSEFIELSDDENPFITEPNTTETSRLTLPPSLTIIPISAPSIAPKLNDLANATNFVTQHYPVQQDFSWINPELTITPCSSRSGIVPGGSMPPPPLPGTLSPLKVKRSYTCDSCGITTTNPREYLYHCRDVHYEKIQIFECQFCIYASKHQQKLIRHCGLVHKQHILTEKPIAVPVPLQEFIPVSSHQEYYDSSPSFMPTSPPYHEQSILPDTPDDPNVSLRIYQCSSCDFQTRNKPLLKQHEKTNHLKKKFYRCAECGYITNEKARYTKHCEFHNLPKIKCSACDFQSLYKWNMDRHMKSHAADGDFKCDKCCFTAFSKQSLTVHQTNHHTDEFADSEPYPTEEYFVSEMTEGPAFKVPQSPNSSAESGLEMCDIQEPPPNWNQQLKKGKLYEKNLQCRYCSYRTAWPSDLKKHETEEHQTVKKHACPLCGVRFEQLSWLVKHLNKSHGEDTEAKNILEVVRMLEPNKAAAAQSSPHNMADSNESYNEQEINGNNQQTSWSSLVKVSGGKAMPTCHICGYRSKWISEMEKHLRVHSDEKPFSCPYCNYRCKWKGDLTRHCQKYHGQRYIPEDPPRPSLKLTLLKSGGDSKNAEFRVSHVSHSVAPPQTQSGNNNNNNENGISSSLQALMSMQATSAVPSVHSDRNATSNKRSCEEFEKDGLPADTSKSAKAVAREPQINRPQTARKIMKSNFYQDVKQVETVRSFGGGKVYNKVIGRKYKCTFCSFTTCTASRFHIHIVQHLNKKPFMCSACGYRSNWQWDITKHIKFKAARDSAHINGTVLLADESGRRNYEKYDKYLVDVSDESKPSQAELEIAQAASVANMQKQQPCVSPNDAESIVVTPDLPFAIAGPSRRSEPQENTACGLPRMLFNCAHCTYKHAEKKVVISHLGVHAALKPFRCRICGVSSNWRHVISRHVKIRHGGDLKDVEDRIAYTQQGHIIKLTAVYDENNKKTLPPVVTAPVSSEVAPRYQCKICPYSADKYFYLKIHVQHHQQREGDMFKCSNCPYFAKFKKSILKHEALHSGHLPTNLSDSDDSESVASLQIKSQDLEEAETSKRHAATISRRSRYSFDGKRHQCEHCPYRTDNKTQYLYHKQFHRPNKLAQFKCKLCSYWSTHQHLISQHQRVHANAIPDVPEDNDEDVFEPDEPVQQNELAGKIQTITKKGSMYFLNDAKWNQVPDKHISTVIVNKGDNYVKMFKCRYCPMVNQRRANVKMHEKMHTKEVLTNRFTCSFCNYQCHSQGFLSAHLKIHQNGSDGSGVNVSVSESSRPIYETVATVDTSGYVKKNSNEVKKVFSYYCTLCPAVFKSIADMETHRSYHGSRLPFQCKYCDYAARQKPHLHKHLLVHGAAYVTKRAAAFPNAVQFTAHDIESDFGISPAEERIDELGPADQMTLLEEAETKAIIQGGAQNLSKMHRCSHCPAAFQKAATFQFHVSLHGSNLKYQCQHCDYAVASQSNLLSHLQIHSGAFRNFQCPKCPASFDKLTRFQRHFSLHGQKEKYTCDKCDYSVHFAANLFKHKPVHNLEQPKGSARNYEVFDGYIAAQSFYPSMKEEVKEVEVECQKYFKCDRCPHSQNRKDAVQSHSRRHGINDGTQCLYCDYCAIQTSFLRDHLKVHLQPQKFVNVQTYTKYEGMEIWSVTEDGEKMLLFKDQGEEKAYTDRFHLSESESQSVTPTKNSATSAVDANGNKIKTEPDESKDEWMETDVAMEGCSYIGPLELPLEKKPISEDQSSDSTFPLEEDESTRIENEAFEELELLLDKVEAVNDSKKNKPSKVVFPSHKPIENGEVSDDHSDNDKDQSYTVNDQSIAISEQIGKTNLEAKLIMENNPRDEVVNV